VPLPGRTDETTFPGRSSRHSPQVEVCDVPLRDDDPGANARQAWRAAAPQERRNHIPWAFISPFRWQYFGNTSFLPNR